MPSKDEMWKDLRDDIQTQMNKTLGKLNVHDFVIAQRKLFNELSELANIENVPDVFDASAIDVITEFIQHRSEFRKYKFNIIDEKNYTKERYEDQSRNSFNNEMKMNGVNVRMY